MMYRLQCESKLGYLITQSAILADAIFAFYIDFDVSKPPKAPLQSSKLYGDVAAKRLDAINNPSHGKSIVVPMRVEPRSYFSNERTFLKWLRISMLLSLLGVGLIEWATEVVNGVFLIIAGTILMLRCVRFQHQAHIIRVCCNSILCRPPLFREGNRNVRSHHFVTSGWAHLLIFSSR